MVKTAASHAVNMGSNPVRVTTKERARGSGAREEDRQVGVDWHEGPPVPIPNTEVKLMTADDSCRATGRENR